MMKGVKSTIASTREIEISGRGPVHLRAKRLDDGVMAIEMGVDYEKAQVPERFYYADMCDVVRDRVGLSLQFGKLIPGTSQLRTKIEIGFPEDQFVRQLWGSSREFHETIRRIAKGMLPPEIDKPGVTDKVQTFRSNNVFMAVIGHEAVMDFYYISPGDIHYVQAKKKHEVQLEPVVRITLGTSVLYEFLEKCRPYAEELNAMLLDEDEKV
jgi:hypothetical protein